MNTDTARPEGIVKRSIDDPKLAIPGQGRSVGEHV